MATKKKIVKVEDSTKKKAEPSKKKTAIKEVESISKKATVKSATSKKNTDKKDINIAKKKVTSKKKIDKDKKEIEELKEIKKEDYIPDEVDIVRDIPDRYNETRLVLMMRDPEWCFFYWDISDNDIAYHSLQNKRISVRIFHVFGYDVTNGEIHKEIEVNYIYGDRYVNLAMPHAYFIGELGYYDENNRFIVLARSSMIYAPRDSISNVYDEEWMFNEEIIQL